MLTEINYLQVVTVCISMLFVCSLIFALVIEAAKKLISEEKIKEKFGSLEIFSLVVSLVLGLVIYVVYLLFFVLGKFQIVGLDIVRFIFIGIAFVFGCGIGSQVGYDKVIKTIKDIFHIN